jgi:hypothetical protein
MCTRIPVTVQTSRPRTHASQALWQDAIYTPHQHSRNAEKWTATIVGIGKETTRYKHDKTGRGFISLSMMFILPAFPGRPFLSTWQIRLQIQYAGMNIQ